MLKIKILTAIPYRYPVLVTVLTSFTNDRAYAVINTVPTGSSNLYGNGTV